MVQTFDFGPAISDQDIEFRLWAPLHDEVLLNIEGAPPEAMKRDDEGWHRLRKPTPEAALRYSFTLADGLKVPDPASRFQPHDVHGPSELVDLSSFPWKSSDWHGRPWEEIIIYELHIGTFSDEGTFQGAIAHLDHLRDLGVTAIQIMPVADFPGGYNWGYDGVMPYSPDSSYGRPEDLMALVDAAHERGLCVFLDVVYNHFGPDGNYMPNYAPLFSPHHENPWGQGLNYDDEQSEYVREFIIQNAIYWVTQFRFDGLRLDAVHAIIDDSDEHLLTELARRVRAAAADRHIHLIVENEDNDSDLLSRDEEGKPERFTAQWNDDIHHVLHIAATGETFGYYKAYSDDDNQIGRALAEGFAFQGEHMPYRDEERGKPSAHLPPTAFISFIQNHDQIGNRALGDRMQTYAPEAALKAITAIYLLAPQIPMLFMGEEWGSRDPFRYFCDFNEDLNQKVRDGRREELSRLPGFDGEDLPDPTAKDTFIVSRLDWSKVGDDEASQLLSFYRTLLDLRKQHIVPLLKTIIPDTTRYDVRDGVVTVDWGMEDGATLRLIANLSENNGEIETDATTGVELFSLGTVSATGISPWAVRWTLHPA
ncbi:malto-oligosyltrehalose trehalohydrolase [Agrobacterium sp. SORGH_AS 787]|uniref:malto-oligosyltrehalose trehalohydrolase n=1 Tax=Agrobacterium sp. SORGH_AS 787 TaxID=3041775 RepID=UPI002782ABE6|nr:malto-oligosyltrehalose trehalohydrolase [Rhizobium sp. SORGH_AS_0787]